ncbi:Iron-sulfur cluster regulator IscR [Anaerovibrio sp. JC8]|uniref:RrF2 family transcriptional regulator n=1 Tax=Anaerovibrio sp. JC8 TaxID=1240085 RepID=UPI000A0C8A2D|nr:RrF2 family transcriptional regulator [Anaerovibrio sp. JC8]ORT99893.1 Iron-sulfur cluster regulator IscR [Anaerovibrio sp. JC8]
MISTKGRYAVRFMIDLAQQPDDKPVTLDDVAQRQEISKKYMERVVKMLVSAGLVKGTSGKGGGYRLLKKPEEYNVMEILQITEGRLTSVACLQEGAEQCPREANCLTVPMWRLFDEMVSDFFTNITIADLIRGHE